MNLDQFREYLHLVSAGNSRLNSLSLDDLLQEIPRVDELSDLPPGATILMRMDLDVPIRDGAAADMSRIQAGAATVEYCRDRGWKTVMFGHVGRDKANSAAPVCQAVSDYLGCPVHLMEDWLDEGNGRLTSHFVEQIQQAEPGSMFMLQNTRKYGIEQALWSTNDDTFPVISERMYSICSDLKARLADVEVNEAIAASNIDFSSSVVPLVMSKTAMGFHITQEMKTHIRDCRQANFVVFSGLKINKLDDLEGIVDQGRLVLIIAAGSLAMALRKARDRREGRDFFIGLAETDKSQKAFIDGRRVEQAMAIAQKCQERGVELVLPVDFVLDNGEISNTIPEGHAQMDVGPKSRDLFARKVRAYIEASRTASEPQVMFYNGVFGKFEDQRFEAGTKSFIPLLKEMTHAGVRTYVGGGEGRAALLRYGCLDDVTHAFTCGGTVLKSLTNKHIAYLKAMYLQNTLIRQGGGSRP